MARNRPSGKKHPKKNRHIDPENRLGHNIRARLPSKPGWRLDTLDSGLRFHTALCSFVLNAPRADFLSERKGRKVPAAFKAIRHRLGAWPVPLWAPARGVTHPQSWIWMKNQNTVTNTILASRRAMVSAWLTSLPGGRQNRGTKLHRNPYFTAGIVLCMPRPAGWPCRSGKHAGVGVPLLSGNARLFRRDLCTTEKVWYGCLESCFSHVPLPWWRRLRLRRTETQSSLSSKTVASRPFRWSTSNESNSRLPPVTLQ